MKKQKPQPHRAPQELLESAHQRTTTFEAKLTKAMKDIEDDIAKNDGLYPLNGGRLSVAEICRRAGVKNKSLDGKKHKTTTKVTVEEWHKMVLAGVVQGKKNVRKTVTGRAESWKEAHRQVAQARHIDQLKLEGALVRNRVLETENAALRAQLSSASEGRVVGLPKRE
ncbi:MAG: hypothetical protein V4858_06315 [Pseudomonadota bacterium]